MDEHKPLLHNDQQKTGIFAPNGPIYRWIVLIIVSLICFGSYFAYDEIQPFESNIDEVFGIDPKNKAKFGLLYSIYSFPNMVLVFFGGLLGDKIGLRLAALVFVSFVFVGSVMVPLSLYLVTGINGHHIHPNQGYWFMVAGRFIFGLGGESLNVIQTSMTALWFSGTPHLALAMGLTLTMSRLGDFLAISISPSLASAFGDFKIALWVGTALCGVSFLSVIIYGVMDRASASYFPDRKVDPSENQLNFGAVRYFDVRFWIVSFLCMSYYSGVTPFVAIASDFLHNVYGYDKIKAGWYSSIVILASMVLSPFLGKLLDHVGRRPYFVVLGSIVILPAHLILAFFKVVNPIIPIVMIGMSFSLVPSTLWPSIPMIIKPKELATAFGLMTAIQNSGLTLTNFVAGKLAQHSYRDTMLFFVGMDCVGLLLGILLIFVDRRMGGTLCQSSAEKKQLAEVSINYDE